MICPVCDAGVVEEEGLLQPCPLCGGQINIPPSVVSLWNCHQFVESVKRAAAGLP